MSRWLIPVIAGAALISGSAFLVWQDHLQIQVQPPIVQFNRDIRPILNQHCTSCHGGVKRLGEVSFLFREEALGRGKSGRPTVVPGNPKASELMVRVTSRDPDIRMPYHA